MLRLGLIPLFLLMFLDGCANVVPLPAPTVIVRNQPLPPPEALRLPCTKPEWQGDTNWALLQYTNALIESLNACNAQWAAIDLWAKEMSNGTNSR